MRNYRILCAICLTAMLVLAGCTSRNQVVNREAEADARHTLSFFGNKYEAANVEVIETILTGFMEENKDIVISYESLKGAEYFEALRNREASGRLDDIFVVNHDTVLDFTENGSLADLSDLVADTPYSEHALQQMKSPDGNIYWVPTTISTFGLYCNLDLLKQHGQSVPATLNEWEQVCDYFVSRGITPIIANNDISLKTLAMAKGFYPLYAERRQQDVFDKINQGEETLSTYLADGFALARSFCDKGYIDAARALETQKTSDDLEQFVQGESPFMLTGAWAAGRVKRMEPDFAFQVVPYPVREDGTVLVINLDVCLSVSAHGQNQAQAKEFISYFLQEENIGQFADNQSSFSPLMYPCQPSLTEIQEIVTSYQSQTPVNGADSQLLFPIWDITADVAKGLLAGEDLDTLMKQMDEQVTAGMKAK